MLVESDMDMRAEEFVAAVMPRPREGGVKGGSLRAGSFSEERASTNLCAFPTVLLDGTFACGFLGSASTRLDLLDLLREKNECL